MGQKSGLRILVKLHVAVFPILIAIKLAFEQDRVGDALETERHIASLSMLALLQCLLTT